MYSKIDTKSYEKLMNKVGKTYMPQEKKNPN